MVSLRRIFVALAAGFCLTGPAAAADPFASDWANNLKSSARLIAGAPSGGGFEAGVEIKLAPGAITYWRNPGDSGLPPTLSFEGSTNLAQARVSFPAPRRIAEAGGGEAFGYDRALVLPIEVDPIEPAKPVTLSLKLNYAVCEQICVPAQASLSLALPGADAPASPYAPAIAKARQETPRPVEWQALAASLERDRQGRLASLPRAPGGAQARRLHRAAAGLVVRGQARPERNRRHRLLQPHARPEAGGWNASRGRPPDDHRRRGPGRDDDQLATRRLRFARGRVRATRRPEPPGLSSGIMQGIP